MVPDTLEKTTERLRQLSPVVTSIMANAEAWLESLPMPAWVKTLSGEMVFINQAYAEVYQVRRDDYIGRRDQVVWGRSRADQFQANDLEVATTRQAKVFREVLSDHRPLTVLKFPVFDGVKLIGVGGMLIQDDRAAGIPRLTAQCD